MLTFEEEMCNLLRAAGPMCAVELVPFKPGVQLDWMWPGRHESERDLGAHHARILMDPADPCDPLETMWFDCAEVDDENRTG